MASEKVKTFTDSNFDTEIKNGVTLVDFWAEWCAPCRQIAPIISELAAEYGDRVKIVKMDIDKHPGTPGQFGIRAIPTILAFKDGRVVQQIQGARPKADFKKMVDELLA